MISARADVVGSLIRPPELLAAQEQLAVGTLTPAEFKKIEDGAVDQAVAQQEQAGLEVVTDGEMRRQSFQSQMTAAVEGFGEHTLEAFLWGEWRGDPQVGNWNLGRPSNLGVVDKLRRRRHLSAEEFAYLRARTRRTAKITLPSPSLWVNFWSRERSGHVYPTLEAFLLDVVEILREEVEELVRLGATYIQIDAPHYALLIDPHTRAFYEQQAGSGKWWLERAIELDNAVMGAAPSHVTCGFHLCRGNQGSRWLAEGSYEPIAPMLFRKIKAKRLLLEYDDARSGSFEPLRYMPDDKMVVLGLVTTKSSRLETREELSERIGEASRYVPLERLALSPQCGFATSIVGNRISLEDQTHKLRLVVETAQRIWD
ncbi:cobalamin-independent methionine synthase II family protein [Acidobacteriia bacterium AH_259_A11_L15]|nr:cobalamin-independent methionine synthase II family protein [Acidobacteriia bacterium AH_259_A11_L15]